MRAAALWLAILVLPGCSVLESRKTMATCQALDTATTLQAVHMGAVETNPIIAPAVAHPVLFIALKGALAWFLWTHWDRIEPAGKATVSLVSCAAPAINLRAIRLESQNNPPRPNPN